MTAAALTERLEPRFVTLDLTYRCPLACGFCFMARASDAPRGREMTRAELGRLVDALSGAPRRFYLSGGEPLLRPDLPWLVRRIKARGHYCRLITGLSAGTGRLPAALAAGLDELTVSVHGTPGMHDACVGRKGAFARIAAACAALNASPRRKTLSLGFWCTVNEANHGALYDVYRALAALGPDYIAFHHLDYIAARDLAGTEGIFRRAYGRPPSLKVTEDLAAGISPRRLMAQIKKIKAARDPRVRFDLELGEKQIMDWYDPAADAAKRGACLGLRNGVWIDPSGNLVSCQPLGLRLGGALRGDIVKTFNGPAYRKFRALLDGRGGFLPTCSRCGRASYMSGPRAGGAAPRSPRTAAAKTSAPAKMPGGGR